MFLGVLLTVVGVVRAGEPTAAPSSDGFWRTEILVPAPLSDVQAALADPIASSRLSPDIVSTTYLARGECPTLRAELAGIVALSYDYKRCATQDGWHETLVASSGLESYEVRWRLQPAGESTRVEYSVRVDPVLPAPQFLIVRQMKKSMHTIVTRLYTKVTGKAPDFAEE